MSLAAGRVRLDEVDRAWLRMDDPTNLMVITGVMVLDAPVSVAEIRELVSHRLLPFPRFRSRVVDHGPAGVALWQPLRRVVLDRHVVEAALPEEDSEAALQAFVSRVMSRPLDRRYPLWQIHVVPRYQGGSALVVRVHHCIGDGLALTHVLLAMSDEGVPGGGSPPGSHEAEGVDPWNLAARALGRVVGATLHVPANLVAELNRVLERPGHLLERTDQLLTGLATVQKLVLMPPDPPTPFRGTLVRGKRVAWSPAIPLERLRSLARTTGSTINDVLMAALAGGLGSYLRRRGHPVPGTLEVRGVVPVNLRPLADAGRLGNEFGLVFLGLPIGLEDPLDRLFEVRRRMRAIKRSPEAVLTLQILRALGLAPRALFDRVVDAFGSKATAVVTNVVGPRQPVRFAGRPMRQALFWVPSAARLGLGVSLFSYDGGLWVGVQADAGLVPDPGVLVETFLREVDRLAELEVLADA